MQFPTQGLRSWLIYKLSFNVMKIALPLSLPLLLSNAAQANDFYYRNHRYPESYHRRPTIIFQLPLQQHSTQSRATTIFQNGQVIRVYEDQNSSGNHGGIYGVNQGVFQRPSIEFSIGNQREYRRVERFPISPWHQTGWNHPIDQSSFRHGFPNRHHRRW